jgi:hypothetical protein
MFKLERVEVALHVVTFGWTWNSYPVNSICWTSKFPSSPLIYSSVRDSDHTQRIERDCTCSYGVMASPMMVKCYSCYLEIFSRYDCVGSGHGSSLLVADSLNWILVSFYEHWMVNWIYFLMIWNATSLKWMVYSMIYSWCLLRHVFYSYLSFLLFWNSKERLVQHDV